jgi:hypothetical protein
MNQILESLRPNGSFSEFEYRLLYLRPRQYSDERICVGIVASGSERLEARFLSSPGAINVMSRLFGDDGVEQFQFAASEIRRAAASASTLETFRAPTDLVAVGDVLGAVTRDREGLLSTILASSSCLMRVATTALVVDSSAVNTPFARDLERRIQSLNPLTSGKLFRQKVTVDSGQVVELPIYGSKIFGAPVSVTGRDQVIRAESWIAKLRWLRNHLPQHPRVYLHHPSSDASKGTSESVPSIREVMAIAETCDVPLRMSESIDELAAQVLKDEAA